MPGSAIRVRSLVDAQDVDDSLVLIDRVKHPKTADAVAPGVGRVAAKLPNVGPEERLCFQLGIHVFGQLSGEKCSISL